MGKAVAALLLLVGAVAHAGPAPDAPSGPRRTVLVLYSISQEVAGLHELSVAVNEGIRRGSRVPVDVYSEYTGLDRFSGTPYAEALRAMLREKYSTRKIDLLILVGPTALEFVLSTNLFPDVPIITCYVAGRLVEAARQSRAEMTGALPAQNAPRTLELMLQLYPETRRILVVLGGSAYERGQAEQGRGLFAAFASRVDLVFTNDLTLDQLEARVRQLTDSELVVWGSLLQDASGRDFETTEPLARVSAASRRPVFGFISEDLGAGILGGELVSMEVSGQVAAQLAVRVLGGEPASSIPPVVDAGLAPTFDARQLERWHLHERALPPGSRILFRKPSLLEEHGRAIGLGLGIIVLESLLVAGLIIQLRRRHRIERALATAETRYRTVADFTHDWEFWRRPDGTFEYMSPACERVSGHAAADFLSDPGLLGRLVHEEDVATWRAAVSATSPQPPVEFRIRTRTGELRWVRFASNPVLLPDGTAAGLRGSLADVTSRKLGELALEQAYREIGALKDRLEAENTYYREKIQAVEPSGELLGQSDAMKYLHFRIRQVAPSDTTVLILGETGTGKELVAEEIHALGPRKDRPLVKVNCAALPPTLAESELFGHEKGAFTGSMAQRKGRFELADGATLFLDEVGELTPELQAKLLRVLQDGTFERVGGDRTLKVDVRVIAATNRALSRDVAAGRFREDLWYRLNVFPISVPPLRQRKEDIPTLALAFVARASERLGRPSAEVPQSVILALQGRDWPGNVRELQNTIEQAVLVSDGGHLRLPDQLPSEEPAQAANGPRSLEEVERRHILEVLEAAGWKLEGSSGAAALLGLKPSTL
ncbi:MAG: sigma 54-interacting transcriptional regulator, partial [Myxococcaceae bacterium]